MTIIQLTTEIAGNAAQCFDIARDIDAHKLSTAKTNERAVAGKTTGLCELGDTITWEANHFGIKQNLTVEITNYNRPLFFEDKMLRGAFKSMRHEHHFEEVNGKTLMKDYFEYEVPFGIFGVFFDKVILKRYMTNFLLTRNLVLKSIIEGNT
jgi:ligand-binding SRPBCC domain-containing protein